MNGSPGPSEVHPAPFHLPTANVPVGAGIAAQSAGPDPSSNTASANVERLFVPTGAQEAPFQRARPEAWVPPALVNVPPAYSFGPDPSSYTARLSTVGTT